MPLRVVMLGDIVGTPGVKCVQQLLPALRQRYQPHLIIANAENAAGGSGLTPSIYQKLIAAGIDGITLGDHVYRKQQITATLRTQSNLVRPANLPLGALGRAWMKLTATVDGQPVDLFVFTLLGRVYMNALPVDEPFGAAQRLLASLASESARPLVLVEIHAEATAEKQALSRYLDGKVAAVLGTHTHVPTADTKILPRGTGYQTDLGMTGPYDSILGREVARVVAHMSTSMPEPFDVATGDPRLCGVLLDIDPATGHTLTLQRLDEPADISLPPFV